MTAMRTTPTSTSICDSWPELTHEYGLSFFELACMPKWARELYERELPRLRAERQFRALECAAYPHMTEGSQADTLRRLREEMGATAHRPARAPKRPTVDVEEEKPRLEDVAGEYAAMGIGVTMVDRLGREVR